MFWLFRAIRDFSTFIFFVSFIGLIKGTSWTNTISTLFCFVQFIIKFDFIFLVVAFLYLSILGRISASNDIIQELVLLLVKERSKKAYVIIIKKVYVFIFMSVENYQELVISLEVLDSRKLLFFVFIKRTF